MGVTCFLLLSGLGLAITAQAQDCNKPTAGPNMDLSDRDILLQTFPDGTRATFVCNKGYTPAGGSAFITCTAGTWNPVTLKCERRSCGSAGEVENGDIDYSDGIDFGSKIVITCKTGYILVGKHEIYCGDQGWLDRLPVCEAVACDPPPVVVDGSFTPEKDVYVYREIVQYSCIHGFTVSGSKSVSCSGDGTFKPDPPTCTRVKCQDPVIENADWVEGSRPPYGYKATVTYKCRTGYRMIGERTQICEINNQWSPGLPTCELVTCHPPPVVADGTFSPKKESYDYNDVVQYNCQKGFTLSGSKSISCSDDGTFKSAPPTCTMVTCHPPPVVADGTFSPKKESYDYNEVVQYNCQKGFTLSGSKSISCSDDGTFKPAPPTCTMVTCHPPPVVADGTFSPKKESYDYNEVVQYNCQKGFTLSGSRTISCSDDGTFKSAPPTCTRITSPTTTTTTTTTTPPLDSHCKDPDIENATVTYQCRPGYKMIGESTQICEINGNGGNPVVTGIVVAVVVIIIFAICGCCGCWIFKKKRGSEKNHADTKAPKSAEEVALSGHERVDQNPADSGCEAGSSLDKPPVMSKNNVC